MAAISDTSPLLPFESASDAIESSKRSIVIQVIPQWTVSTGTSLFGTSCRLPHYSYSIEAPDAATESFLFKTVVEKVKITMDALTHHTVQNRLKLSHHNGNTERIHPETDYGEYVSLLIKSARQTEDYIAASGPFEANLSIIIAEGRTGTAGSCDCPSNGLAAVMKQFSPLKIKNTSPVDRASFNNLRSLGLSVLADPKVTRAAWSKARNDAGTSLKVAKNQSLVTEDALKNYCVR